MPTIDLTGGKFAFPSDFGVAGKVTVLKNILDFKNNPAAQSDVVKALAIPAGTVVLSVCCKPTTLEGGTLTVDVGITGGDTDGWGDGIDLNANAGTVQMSGALPAAGGVLYTTDETIDLLMNNAADAAVVEIAALVYHI